MMDTTRERLFHKISDAAGNVFFTCDVHWNIVKDGIVVARDRINVPIN